MARRLAVLALAVVAVAIVWLVRDGGSQPHTLRAAFASALQIRPGQEVQIAGRQIGSISSAKLIDGRAVVEMAIDDEHWPLHRGTTASLRFGSALGYALRYVEVKPGPRSAPALPEGGILTRADTITPVEFDDTTRIFGPRTRRDMARVLQNAGAALRGTGPDLNRLLEEGGPGMESIADQTADFAEDPNALRLLVTASAAMTDQIARNDDRLGPLLRDAATTMDTLGDRSDTIGELLDEAPGTFTAGQRVLRHFERTSGRLEVLSRAFAPGAKELRALAPVSNRVTGTLADTTPRFASLLQDGNRALPSITRFTDRANGVLPTAGEALSGVTDGIACLRPYAPELAGYLATTAAAHASYDATGHYIRFGLAAYPSTSPSTTTPAEMIARFPRLHYGMVRPPGLNGGQPWYQPQCGITPEGMDPLKDLETGG